MGRLARSIGESIVAIFADILEFCTSGSPLQQGIATIAAVVGLVFVFAAIGKK